MSDRRSREDGTGQDGAQVIEGCKRCAGSRQISAAVRSWRSWEKFQVQPGAATDGLRPASYRVHIPVAHRCAGGGWDYKTGTMRIRRIVVDGIGWGRIDRPRVGRHGSAGSGQK